MHYGGLAFGISSRHRGTFAIELMKLPQLQRKHYPKCREKLKTKENQGKLKKTTKSSISHTRA